jgi:beta-lactamase class D
VSPVGKRSVLVGGVVVMVAIVVTAVVMLDHSGPDPAATEDAAVSAAPHPSAPDPTSAARQYLQAFAAGHIDAASASTDAPQVCSAVLLDAWSTLRPAEIQVKPGKVTPAAGNTATATYTATWSLDGGHVWSYNGTLGIVRAGSDWRVHWTPAVLQPTLQAGQRLVIVTTVPDHPAIVDRDGKPLAITGTGGTHLVSQAEFPQLHYALLGQPRPPTPDVFAVERVDGAGHDLQTLFGTTGGQAKPLQSTLSTTVQAAAQAAVDSYDGKAVIMALQPSDGGLLAVAQNARSTGSPFDGLYAPGSTFKIVTATAALEAGIATKDSVLPCPLTELIGTRTISNEGFSLGTTTMHRAFARSCNTTFGKLASQLPSDGLADAANQYGLDADFSVPSLSTQTGKVVPATNSDQQVEDGIGQGTVEVSPFGEVLMAATVAVGHAVTPRLWLHTDNDTSINKGYTAPPSSVLASLRTMMREVVTGGTGTGLAHSGTVYGKTGTAQVGAGAEAHGWFVGYRGDVAFVVFLEDANDSHPAVTLGAKFLAGLQ